MGLTYERMVELRHPSDLYRYLDAQSSGINEIIDEMNYGTLARIIVCAISRCEQTEYRGCPISSVCSRDIYSETNQGWYILKEYAKRVLVATMADILVTESILRLGPEKSPWGGGGAPRQKMIEFVRRNRIK